VVFIVIAVSAGRGLLVPASAGALAACLLVAGGGLCRASSARAGSREYTEVCCRRDAVCVRRILDGRRPWSGLAGADLAIVAFAALFLAVGGAAVALARRSRAEVLP